MVTSSNIVFAHDPFPPEIKFVSPVDDSTVSGIVKIKTSIRTHTAIDNKGLNFEITGPNNYKKVIVDSNPNDGWQCNWDTASVPNGVYTIKAEAWDIDYPSSAGTKNIQIKLYNTKKATKLTVNDIKSSENSNTNIIATLKDNSNKGIPNKSIEFTINGKTYLGTTDNVGIVKISFKGVKGIYSINAKFLGDNLNSPSSDTGKLTITKNAYLLKVNNINVDKNKKTQLKAILTYNNKKIANKTIKFYVDNKLVGSNKTNKNGIVTLKYNSKLDAGKHTISARYGSDIINTAILKVKKASIYIQITSNKAKPKVGTNVIIYYRIKNDGPDSGTNTKMIYKVPKGFKYINSLGSGSKKYNDKTKIFTWTLKKAKVGTSLIKLVFKTKKSGRILLSPKITTETHNPNLSIPKTYITVIK
jgi:hypothetical protein